MFDGWHPGRDSEGWKQPTFCGDAGFWDGDQMTWVPWSSAPTSRPSHVQPVPQLARDLHALYPSFWMVRSHH
jgi:hypothetical protein